MQDIPNIDLARYQNGAMTQGELAELARACEDHGFFILSGHGQEPLINTVFAQAEAFFAQSKEHKLAVMRNSENPLGYYDRELTKQRRDQKEVFDFKAGGHISPNPARQTRWPQTLTDFRPVLTDFFSEFTSLSEQIMAMIFTALGMPAADVARTMQAGFGEQHSSAARLNYYPSTDPVAQSQREQVAALGDMALHHHTDPGAITLLLQDDHGGLQARSKRHGWIDVPPMPGSIVINIGDVMQVWTNDRCTAGIHRVLPVHSERGRYSTPFFYQPRIDAVIEPWTVAEERPRYRPFSWRDFIRGRVADNFADIGDEDIQIAQYRTA